MEDGHGWNTEGRTPSVIIVKLLHPAYERRHNKPKWQNVCMKESMQKKRAREYHFAVGEIMANFPVTDYGLIATFGTEGICVVVLQDFIVHGGSVDCMFCFICK